MRINLYGNVCQNAYALTKWLREAGVDARLFVERNFPWLPEHEDPELRGRYPPWIHVTADLRWRRYGLFDRDFVARLGDCDLVHTFYYGPIWARKTGRPFVFQTYGGDLNVLPFRTGSLHQRYLAWAQRRGIRDAARVLVANPKSPVRQDAIRRLGLTRVALMPLPIDTDMFASKAPEQTAQDKAEWLFFHPARHVWGEGSAAWEQKGNDRVFRAFARFLQITGSRARLLAIRHGPNIRASELLVHDLGIAHAVEWMAPVSRRRLVELYQAADIVLDQFVLGAFGGCTLEALSCGRPVFTSLVEDDNQPPVVNVTSEEEICEALVKYTSDPRSLCALGRVSRQWILDHHGARRIIHRYIAVYEEILAAARSTARR